MPLKASKSTTEVDLEKDQNTSKDIIGDERYRIEKSQKIIKILVLGGYGRVGGSTVRSLSYLFNENGESNNNDDKALVQISVGGKSHESFLSSKKRWKNLSLEENKKDNGKIKDVEFSSINFAEMDYRDEEKLKEVLCTNGKPNYDLVVNTAGPFQQLKDPIVLRSCIELGINYMDVCDDIDLSKEAKALHEKAKENKVTCLISTGVWPGLSSLMAKEIIQELQEDSSAKKVTDVDFSFYTAGSGGAGTTILSATFLILSEKVLKYINSIPKMLPSTSESRFVDFGQDASSVGKREVFLMNLLETYSCHEVFGIPNVSSRFGTAPPIWNKLLKFMALLPSSFLKDRDKMQLLALASTPAVRLVDLLVGSANAMRVDGKNDKGEKMHSIFIHEDLETCVGNAIAAFAFTMLKYSESNMEIDSPESSDGAMVLPYGVFYPEEILDFNKYPEISEIGTQGCSTWTRCERKDTKIK